MLLQVGLSKRTRRSNIEFNWSLAGDDVTPHGEWPSATLLVQAEELANTRTCDGHLSTEPICLHKTVLWIFKDDRTRVRVISDSPLVALFAQNLLGVKRAQAHCLLITMTMEQLLLKCNHGAANLSTVQDAVGLAKKKLLNVTESESLVVPSDVLMTDDKVALVFNATGSGRVTSFFGGAVVDAASKLSKKRVVALENGMAVNVPCNNLVDHPKLRLIDKAEKGVKSISVAEATALLKKIDATRMWRN
ncbi:putative phosphoenolpyruvate carboxykinase, ATP-utilizing [Plasmopara halstedii]